MKKLTLSILLSAASAAVVAPSSAHAAVEAYASWYRPSTSTAYLYLRNTSDKPLTLNKLLIDGTEESPTPWPLDPNRKSDWFDLVPATVPPGQVGQIRVHLRGDAAKRTTPVSLTADTSDGNLTASVPPTPSPLTFSDITFAKDGSEASLFLPSTTSPIQHVLLDGTDVTADCDLSAAAPHQGVAAAFYHPKSPLPRGSYHTWELVTADHHRAIYTMRTLTNDFILGTYGQPIFQTYKDASLNLYISFGRVPAHKIDDLGKLGMTGAPVPFIGGQVEAKTHQYKPLDDAATKANLESLKANPALAFYSAPDEPDGADHPLGVGTHGRSIIAMRNLAYQIDPSTPTFVQIDNTYRPANYHVYAESMDYSATHRYNLGQPFLDEDFSAMQELRSSTAPQPYLWVTQLYPIREKVGEHSNYNGRDPLPPEMHVQMLESLAGGTKGLIHYIHSGSKGGRGGSGQVKSLWDAMIPMHQQIDAVGPTAVRSTPTPWATSSDPKLRVQTLFASPKDLLLVAINTGLQSTKTTCTVPPIDNPTITLSLPPYCHITSVTEVLPGGKSRKTNFSLENNVLTLHPARVNVGTIYRLQGDH